MTVALTIRTSTAQDLPFIWNSWLKSYRDNNGQAKAVASETYFTEHRALVGALCKRSAILIACAADYPEQIYGYAVFEAFAGPMLVLHYVYVKRTYRRFGIASELVAKARLAVQQPEGIPIGATHVTRLWHNHLRDRWGMWFNPYLLGLTA